MIDHLNTFFFCSCRIKQENPQQSQTSLLESPSIRQKTRRKNKWRDGDVLNGFKCVSQLTITRSLIHLNAPEERESEKGLIERIQRPALLIRLISQLPGVNYHTHTSRCCSTYIIITVAKIENNLKLMIWGFPPSSGHTYTHINTQITTPLPSIISAWTSQYIPKPPSLPGASCFWDWFHLFNDGCANDPSHMPDCVTDTTTPHE